MQTTYDFTIVASGVNGISRVCPLNEDALEYLVEEAHMSVFTDGSAALFSDKVGDFMSDASWAHLSCEYV